MRWNYWREYYRTGSSLSFFHWPRKYATLEFFECLGLDSSQDAAGIFDAMIAAFQKHNLSSLKIIFLSSDGASVNSGHKPGLIFLLCENQEWVTFKWCFSHCLELALKDGLKMYTSPVDESLMHLFHLYKNSSKKLRIKKPLSVNESSIWNVRWWC